LKRTLAVLLSVTACVGLWAQSGYYDYAFSKAPYSGASDFIGLLANRSYSRAAGMVADRARVNLPAEALEDGWEALLERYGRFLDKEVTGADLEGDQWTIHVLCTFAKGKVDLEVRFSSLRDSGQVTGVSFSKIGDNERR
jgi:hypothetical protein